MRASDEYRRRTRGAGASITPADPVPRTTPEARVTPEAGTGTECREPARFGDDTGQRSPECDASSGQHVQRAGSNARATAADGNVPLARGETAVVTVENQPAAAPNAAVGNDTACEGGRR